MGTELAEGLIGLFRGLQAANDLNQLHYGDGVEEVKAGHLLSLQIHLVHDVAEQETRGVCDENTVSETKITVVLQILWLLSLCFKM